MTQKFLEEVGYLDITPLAEGCPAVQEMLGYERWSGEGEFLRFPGGLSLW